MKVRLALASGMLATCLWSAGCGETAKVTSEKTVPVTGTVTYNGQPVADATVTFVPETAPGEAASGRGAFGRTDAAGKFELMAFNPGDGAVPGTYKVTITKTEGETASGPETGADDYVDPAETETPAAAPKQLLPAKYGNVASTDQKATVAPEGAQEFTFDLKD